MAEKWQWRKGVNYVPTTVNERLTASEVAADLLAWSVGPAGHCFPDLRHEGINRRFEQSLSALGEAPVPIRSHCCHNV